MSYATMQNGRPNPVALAAVIGIHAAGLLHGRDHRLGSEELVLEIDGHALVPIRFRHVEHGMAIVVRGVVDEHVAAAQPVDHTGERVRIAIDLRDVAAFEHGRDGRVLQAIDQRLAGLFLHVHEGDGAALAGETFDQPFSDAGAAPLMMTLRPARDG